MTFTIFYVTFPNIEEASRVGTALLERKFIACANYAPIRSMYFWKGNLEDNGEIIALFKTSDTRAKKLEAEIKKLHTYELPCIIQFKVESNKEYEDRVKQETK